MELEAQGAYGPIAPGASMSWTVRWALAKLPAAIEPDVGSVSLVGFVESL